VNGFSEKGPPEIPAGILWTSLSPGNLNAWGREAILNGDFRSPDPILAGWEYCKEKPPAIKRSKSMRQRLNKDGVTYLLKPFRWTLLMAISFFLAAGRVDFPRAWLAFTIHFLGALGGGTLMWRFAPGLANRRASVRQGTKTWDKVILTIYFALILLVIPISAGLDVGRYRWSQLGMDFTIVGIVFYLVFFVLFYWAMLINNHFEASSRIQKDRAHSVIKNGPYSVVRHPGYTAMLFASLTDALMIGSLVALIPSIFALIVMVLRTFLEDRMLQMELEGYTEYTQRIKYRLIPGIW
jgi:protein-S-isoprenylcysteine O-methyltransferase Ste14